jgi:hypothetical protein
MKRLVLFLFVLFIFIPVLKAQDIHDPIYGNLPPEEKETKMNPDGYIDGVTLLLEPGYAFANGKFKQDIHSQNINTSNPFLKLSIFLPMQDNATVFLNTLIASFRQENKETDFLSQSEMSYTTFSISAGIKFYIK